MGKHLAEIAGRMSLHDPRRSCSRGTKIFHQ